MKGHCPMLRRQHTSWQQDQVVSLSTKDDQAGGLGFALCVLCLPMVMSLGHPCLPHATESTTESSTCNAPLTVLPVQSFCMQSAEGEVRRGRRTMIFCSSVDSCRAVEHALRERGLPTLCYHGDVPLEERGRAMQEFSGTEGTVRDALASADVHAGSRQEGADGARTKRPGSGERSNLNGASKEDGEVRPLLVCSDLAARCCVMKAPVRHAVCEMPVVTR